VSADRVDRTERLLNLVVCLMASRFPVPRDRLVEQIPGYQNAPSTSALERMFERDKDDLRALGVPLVTVTNAHGEVEGYRISREEYVLPDIHLTRDERMAVNAAAAAWHSGVLGATAATAVAKLQARDPAPTRSIDETSFVQFDQANGALFTLLRALRLSQSVQFGYRKPGEGQAQERRVDPWGVAAQEGHWYLAGFDHGREAQRVFRISRIDGAVRVIAAAISVPRPPDFDVRQAITGQADDPVEASVWVAPHAAAEVRAHGIAIAPQADGDLIQVRIGSPLRLRQLVGSAGSNAVLRDPIEIRDAIAADLRAVLTLHQGDAS
jgi:proteasome accessory factor B